MKLINFKHCFIKINFLFKIIGDWGLGIGDWGLGIGDWAQSPIPNPQSPLKDNFNKHIYILLTTFN